MLLYLIVLHTWLSTIYLFIYLYYCYTTICTINIWVVSHAFHLFIWSGDLWRYLFVIISLLLKTHRKVNSSIWWNLNKDISRACKRGVSFFFLVFKFNGTYLNIKFRCGTDDNINYILIIVHRLNLWICLLKPIRGVSTIFFETDSMYL